jgi:hypothetical protein
MLTLNLQDWLPPQARQIIKIILFIFQTHVQTELIRSVH